MSLSTSVIWLEKQRSPNLYNLHGMRCRFLRWDRQWAGQQQLSGDHRLQKEGERRGWLEDIVRIHTCVVHKHTHIHRAYECTHKDRHIRSITHTHTHTLAPTHIWTWASSCRPLCGLHLQQQEQVTTLKEGKTDPTSNTSIHLYCTEENWDCYKVQKVTLRANQSVDPAQHERKKTVIKKMFFPSNLSYIKLVT